MYRDLVHEATTGTGTGDLTLAGAAETRYRTFNAAFSTGSTNKFRYVIHHRTLLEWEVGIGYMSTSTNLVREAVISSSNSDALVNFSAGTKDVYCSAAHVDVGGVRVHNVLAYGAKGDSDYTSAGGTDDAAAFQRAIDTAILSGNNPVVVVPGGRTYKIGTTLDIPIGLTLMGMGGKEGAGTGSPPILVWGGAANGILLDCSVVTQNIPSTKIENLGLTGRIDLTDLPLNLLRFRGTGGALGALDTGSWLKNVFFQVCAGDGIRIEGGATNFIIDACRWDRCEGYGIYVGLTDTDGVNFSCSILGNCTWTTAGTVQGFMYLDAESNDNGASNVKIFGLHCEIGHSLIETYAGGTNPYDKKGLIRLGVSATRTSVQHKIFCFGLETPPAGGVDSFSIFQITAAGGTDADNSRMAQIMYFGGYGMSGTTESGATGEYRFIGGRIPTADRHPFTGSNAPGLIIWGKGKNFTGEHVTHWIHGQNFIMEEPVLRGCLVSELPSDWPKTGMQGYVTDANATTFNSVVAGGGSNAVPVHYDGTNWRIG
jgi:hypothetical protein